MRMPSCIERFKNTLALYRNAKYTYSYYKLMMDPKYEGLISYYTSLQHVHLFAENTLILQLSILIDKDEKFGLQKVLNCLDEDRKLPKDKIKKWKMDLQFDSELVIKIKSFRDKYISHLDFEAVRQPPNYISEIEYSLLLEKIEAVLNSIMSHLGISENLNLIPKISMEATLDNLDEYRRANFVNI